MCSIGWTTGGAGKDVLFGNIALGIEDKFSSECLSSRAVRDVGSTIDCDKACVIEDDGHLLVVNVVGDAEVEVKSCLGSCLEVACAGKGSGEVVGGVEFSTTCSKW